METDGQTGWRLGEHPALVSVTGSPLVAELWSSVLLVFRPWQDWRVTTAALRMAPGVGRARRGWLGNGPHWWPGRQVYGQQEPTAESAGEMLGRAGSGWEGPWEKPSGLCPSAGDEGAGGGCREEQPHVGRAPGAKHLASSFLSVGPKARPCRVHPALRSQLPVRDGGSPSPAAQASGRLPLHPAQAGLLLFAHAAPGVGCARPSLANG